MAVGEAKKYRIVLIEAEKLSHLNSVKENDKVGSLSTFGDKKRKTELFVGAFDYSLESLRLKEVFDDTRLPKTMFFEAAGKDYTTAIINVSFQYSKHDYVKIGSEYLLSGTAPEENGEVVRLNENGKIISIRLYKNVEGEALSEEVLGDYFAYDLVNNYYIRRPAIGKGFIVYNGGLCAQKGHKPSGNSAVAGTYVDKKGKTRLAYIYLHKDLGSELPLDEEVLGDTFEYDSQKNEYKLKKHEIKKKLRKAKKTALDEKLKIVEEYYYACGETAGKSSFDMVANALDLRKELYEDGFYCDGRHYVRYKRSAGSSRTGNCLFIAEPLEKKMKAWSRCGLEFEEDEIDLASYEAYISLSLSSINSEITIPRSSLLIMKDAKSIFEEEAITIDSKHDGSLFSKRENATIENTIWDGEALLDSSIFNENGYESKGMMLLRNRFFKTCAFNTNLSLFFKENNITDISQLNGYTEATSIDDIKMIVTDSSIKYLKIAPKKNQKQREKLLSEWLKKTDEVYGVVKTDKPTGYFGGRLVRTSYQLINTLGLSREKTRALVAPTLEYYDNIKSDPMYLRNYISYMLRQEKEDEWDSFDEDEELSFYNIRQEAMMDLISTSNEISDTEVYNDFKKTIMAAFSKKVKAGRLLVSGTYATLFGNGLELLYASIGKFKEGDAPLALDGDEKLYCSFFENGAKLLGCRSPHVTMGNLLYATNVYCEEIDKYFNLSREIVCVNAIKSNIQQRLNGCDYDSDTMLLTDNNILAEAAKKRKGEFLVPVLDVPSSRKQYKNTAGDKALLDHSIAQNKIGEIINRSQLLNSIYWQRHARDSRSIGYLQEAYEDICILAVMSGMEIDKAKRNYDFDADRVLFELKKKYANDNELLPKFFAYGVQKGKIKKGEVMEYNTTMDYLYSEMEEHARRQPHDKATRPLGSFLDMYVELSGDDDFIKGDTNDSKRVKKIEEILVEAQKKIESLRAELKGSDDERKRCLHDDIEDAYKEATEALEGQLKNGHILKRVLEKIDEEFFREEPKRSKGKKKAKAKDEEKAETKSEKKLRWLALELLCKERGHLLPRAITGSRESDMHNLVIDENGEVSIYGIPHTKKVAKFAKN